MGRRRSEGDAADLDAADLWALYGRHAALIFGGGPTAASLHLPSSFAVLSGADHVDLNQAALFGSAGETEVRRILDLVAASGVPVVLARSMSVENKMVSLVRDAGFEQMPEPELLFAMAGVPEATDSVFVVRPIATSDDVAAMQAMFLDVHDYASDLTGPMFGVPAMAGGAVSGWLAWEGDEAVSCAFVTHTSNTLGLWEVMTPVRHRRRGAGSAVVRQALRGATALSAGPIERVVFWASPAGRPLYEALGFHAIDAFEVWTYGARPEELAAVGAG